MFENVIALFGIPGSGTTIISRLIANHSRVQTITEPYSSRRMRKYNESHPVKLARDFKLEQRERSSLLVKETLTQKENIELVQRLLDSASTGNIRSAYIFVLRSPLEAFLSQVDAANTFWAKAMSFGESEASVRSFWKSYCQSMDCYLAFALRFHRRFIVYDRFRNSPREEIGRAMTLFGYPFEQSQTDVDAAQPNFADPADDHAKADGVARISEKFGNLPEFMAMKGMHEYVKEISIEQTSSSTIVTNLAVMVKRGTPD